ncbi:uncharacterized protein LOC135499680 [Lineus longissimus]|uniref:uncharacterized protein LOC135499680 n=1 Tax=Lineus longissimus TaxID=88925 RepID=UPI002B4F6F99
MVDPGMNSGVADIHVVDDIEKVFSVLSSELVGLSTEWKFLMRRLDLTNEDLVEIDTKYKTDGPREVIYQCMLRWHSRVGEAASVVKLVRALRQERLHRVADLIKTYTVRIPCTRCPIGGHDPSCYQATPTQITRQKTKIKIKTKQKFPSKFPKLPKIYSPNSSIGSLNSSRRSSGGSISSRSSTKKMTKRRPRTMSCDSTTSITSSNPSDDVENGSEDEKEDVTEPKTEILEHVEEQPAPLPPTPSPEVQEAVPTETPKLKPVKETPAKKVEKQVLQERVVTGHLRVDQLIPEGGIPPNFTDLFKDMCAHLYKTIVKQAEDNIRALEEIVKLKNFFVHHLVVGSVIISMSCHGDACYQELKAMYKSGELLRACQKVFGRENLLQDQGIHYVRYSLHIDDFEDGVPPPEETFTAPALQEEGKDMSEEPEEEKESETVSEETPEKPKREKTTMVTVEVCANLTASIDTDIPTSSLLQSLSESGYREANARKYYKTVTRDDVMNDAIDKMNTLTSIPGLKFARLDLKKDGVDVVMTCSTRKAINDAYSYFLKKKLLNICIETLLTKEIKKLAGEELIQLELEIQDTHITKCEKLFKERLTKIRSNRNGERGSANGQRRGISNNWQKARIVLDSMKREKSVISPPNSNTNSRRTSRDNSRKNSTGSAK